MAGYFFDTSALAKAFRIEEGSTQVIELLAEPSRQAHISSLTIVEFQSVFAQKVRAGSLPRSAFELVRRKFGEELRTRRLEVTVLDWTHQKSAEQLIVAHAPFRRLRTLDALQLAMAQAICSSGAVSHFIVADKSLAEVAKMAGVSVIVPQDSA
jgi:uncharacterized protein